jgi:2-polyprenyl-3-methyl-5-hydroxy-6-metoxy-1,4-benzoquinol methylase
MNKAENYWDKQADEFEIQLNDHYRNVLGKLQKYLSPSDLVLDYGCATGLVSHELAGRVREIHGLDISSKMIAVAKRIAAERNIDNAKFAHGTVFDDRYPDETFDVILTFNVLHLLEDAPGVVKRFNQLLKPGGVFVSMTHSLPETTSFMGVLQVFIRKLGLVPNVNMPKISELQNLISNGNFHIVEAENLSKSPPFAYYVVAKKN